MTTRRDFLHFTAAALVARATQAAQAAEPPAQLMHKRPIPSTGEPLPIVGCGTWRTFDVGDDAARRRELADVLRVLFAAGGSVIDSSPMYGSSEAVAGALLTQSHARDKAFIATKVWTDGREAGIAQMEQSMRLLADRSHRPHADSQPARLAHASRHAARLESRRQIRYIGITHYTSGAFTQVEAVLRAERIDFVQINYAANDRDAEARLLPLAAERGVAVIVNQPFGGGRCSRACATGRLPAFAAELGCACWAQLLLKFVLGNAAVTCVIPGTGRPEYMIDNARAGIGIYPDAAMRQRIADAVA